MNLKKTLARVVALAVVAAPTSMALTAAPAAQANHTLATTVTITPLSQTGPVKYGDDVTISGSIRGSDGSTPLYGTATLMAMPYGATAWTAVATDTTPSSFSFYDVKPTISTAYQVVYSGHTAANAYQHTYQPASSAPLQVAVARALSIKHKGLRMWGKVTPAFAKAKLVFKLKKGKKYKKWFSVKTDKKGKFSKRVPGRTGAQFIVLVPAGGGYAATADAYRITRSYFRAAR